MPFSDLEKGVDPFFKARKEQKVLRVLCFTSAACSYLKTHQNSSHSHSSKGVHLTLQQAHEEAGQRHREDWLGAEVGQDGGEGCHRPPGCC